MTLAGSLLLTSASVARAQTATAVPEAPPGTRTRQTTIHLDPSKSQIRWVLSDTIHTVNGTFQIKGGLITFNPETGVADGEVLVDVATGASGNSIRDNKMKTQVLETQKYPTAFFHPTLIRGLSGKGAVGQGAIGTGASKAGSTEVLSVEGTLNIHGADHPLTLKVEFKVEGSMVTATTHFVVPYVAWGMKDPSLLMLRVAKQVDVEVTAQGKFEAAP